MIKHAIAKRYAKALFESDLSTGDFSNSLKDFQQILDFFHKHPKILNVLSVPQLSQNEKEVLVKTSNPQFSNNKFFSFIFYLMKKNRLHSLNEISLEYEKLVDIYEKTWKVELVSKIPIETTLKDELLRKLEKFYNKKITFNEVIDPHILGGVILRVGNRTIDWTIGSRLNTLKEKLLTWNF